ncbi:MAG: 4Fe-4S single cluster domain-containing protein [Actinomycetota bacterium]
MALRVHRFLPLTRVEGPGARACVWVQGCPIRCPGCGVPWTWPEEGGTDYEVADLVAEIARGPEVEGLTLMGGEPFAQAGECARLAGLLRRAGLGVVTFTGYTIEEIRSTERPGRHDLLAETDLLIDGPYVRELADLSRPWTGSSNQRYHFLTPRYAHLEARLDSIPNRVEVRLGADGRIEMNGMCDLSDWESVSGTVNPFC